jgi:hypothetical protein
MEGTPMDYLFSFSSYPDRPGYKKRVTSRQAAKDISRKAPTLRDKILSAIKGTSGLTADEACYVAGVDILAGRPRVSELARKGQIVDTGRRRALVSGKMGVVWAERKDDE